MHGDYIYIMTSTTYLLFTVSFLVYHVCVWCVRARAYVSLLPFSSRCSSSLFLKFFPWHFAVFSVPSTSFLSAYFNFIYFSIVRDLCISLCAHTNSLMCMVTFILLCIWLFDLFQSFSVACLLI
jgi:hypothetical protein